MSISKESNSDLSLFENHEWLGQFWFPDSELKFAGVLRYRPSTGVEIQYLVLPHENFPETQYLHGVLDNGKPCTLFGKFSISEFSSFATSSGTHNFKCCVIGAHITPNTYLKEFYINISSMQDFFTSENDRKTIQFNTEQQFKYSGKSISICIVNEGKFEYVTGNFGNKFYSKDKEITGKINDFFSVLSQEKKGHSLTIRNDIKWLIEVSKEEGLKWHEGIYYAATLYHLFSLLLFRPTRPIEISANLQIENSGYNQRLRFLSTIENLDDRTIPQLTNTSHHHSLSIRSDNIDLASVFKTWIETQHEYDTFIPKLANTFRTYRNYELKSSIIMLLTHLEKIAFTNNRSKKEKYDFPIIFYDRTNTKETLEKLLETSSETIGTKLSALRGELAHIGQGKANILSTLPPLRLVGISICLDIIIATHIFTEMGISEAVIYEFQNHELEWPRLILESST